MAEAKKVAIITNLYNDVLHQRKEVVEGLVSAGYQVLIFCQGTEKLFATFGNSIEYYEVPIDRRGKNPFHDMKMLIQYIKKIRLFKPDIILTYTTKPNIYGSMAARFFHVPYIMNVTGLGSVFNASGFIALAVMKLYTYSISRAGCVFFQNEENQKVFEQKNIHCNSSHVIPGSGVNIAVHRLEPYPQSDKIIRFLFVSRILKEKGIFILIEAAKVLKKQYSNLEFHICGPCEKGYEKYIHRAHQDDIIIYHGPQDNIHRFMKKCHALIHPSFYPEGTSNVCLEAASTGRPVLTTDMPGCRNTVNDGESGFIFKPNDVSALIKTIKKFLLLSNEEKRTMGLAGRAKVKQEFNRQIIVDCYLKEIKRLI
ncbi:glycosyltransferase family 4 protein [Butyricicoccus intestinisimiae]|jgi:glycosyltransferase involved in cell wall biosynthesis|uniref:glycosyltransferase family 4 protein n=1 Tax=Butyricicoccus intestinisimiae TaxID=2841509 RepID=UPI003D8F9052